MNRIKPIFKKGIPPEKFRKIFYPKLYSKENIKDPSSGCNNKSLDFDALIDRDLYNIKENSLNKRYASRKFESETSNNVQSGVLVESYLGINDQRKTCYDFHKGLPLINTKQKKLLKNNTKENELAIIPYKSYNVNKFSVAEKCSFLSQSQHEQDASPINMTEYGIDQFPKDLKNNQRAKIEEMEKILRYMLEKHNSSLTNPERTKYRKAIKQNIELFELQQLNKNYLTENKPKIESKETNDLQKLIDRIKVNMKHKIECRSIKRKNLSVSNKSSLDIGKIEMPFINYNTIRDCNPVYIAGKNIQYGKIRTALINYPAVKRNEKIRSASKVNKTFETKDIKVTQHNKSITSKVASKLKCSFQKLTKSIDNQSETMKIQAHHIHKITKELNCNPTINDL